MRGSTSERLSKLGTSQWSSRLFGGGDAVTQAFEYLRLDIELTLRKHEAEVRKSMETMRDGEQTATDENGEQSLSKPLGARSPSNHSHEQASNLGIESQAILPGQSSVSSPAHRLSQNSLNPRNIRVSLSNHLAATRSKTSDIDKKPRPSSQSRKVHWSQRLVKDETGDDPNSVWDRAKTSLSKRTLSAGKMFPKFRLVREDSPLHGFAKSKLYKTFWSLVIALDAALVIAELSYSSKEAKDSDYTGAIRDFLPFVVFADLFCLFMIADLLFQLILEFPDFDMIRGRTGYRWFNILVIIEQLLQVISQHARPHARSVSKFRIVVSQASVLRLIRAILVLPEIAVKMELGVQEFRVMIRSLMGAFQPLVWCATPLLFILANFGVFITEGVLAFLLKNDSSEYDDLISFFGTLDTAVLSLYKGILGGMDWGELYDVLIPLVWILRFAFLFFICFNCIAMLNIVAAVFIKTAFVRSESDRHFQIKKELDAKQTYLDTMQDVFAELDEDGDGMIYFSELENHLGKPEVGAYFSRLGVDVNEVEKLFLLLDEDGSGCIDKAEFTFGCLRLKGEAKSLDLAILHREVQAMARDIVSVHGAVRNCPAENVVVAAQPPAVPPQPSRDPSATDLATFKILRQEVRGVGELVKSLHEKFQTTTASI